MIRSEGKFSGHLRRRQEAKDCREFIVLLRDDFSLMILMAFPPLITSVSLSPPFPLTHSLSLSNQSGKSGSSEEKMFSSSLLLLLCVLSPVLFFDSSSFLSLSFSVSCSLILSVCAFPSSQSHSRRCHCVSCLSVICLHFHLPTLTNTDAGPESNKDWNHWCTLLFLPNFLHLSGKGFISS